MIHSTRSLRSLAQDHGERSRTMIRLLRWMMIVWSIALVATSSPAIAEDTAPFVGTVTGNTVNIRAGGNRNYEVIHQVNRGEPRSV